MDPVIYLETKEFTGNREPVPSAAEIAGLSTKLSEAREQLSASIGNARLEAYAKFCELSTEVVGLAKALEKHRGELEKAKWTMKFSAGVLAVVLGVAGYFGFRYGYRAFYGDVKEGVTGKLEGEIRQSVITENRAFYEDLVAGNALDAAGQYANATERLMGAFKQGHTQDPAVLLPLLDAIYKGDDWENGEAVVDALEKQNVTFGGTSGHAILAYIGAIEVQAAEMHPDWLEKGFASLEKAQLWTPPGDKETLSLIHTNYWVYAIQREDWKGADTEISALKELDVPVYGWETTRRWRFFAGYFAQVKNLGFEPRIRGMWSQLRVRAGG
jgi:hypothetical protein